MAIEVGDVLSLGDKFYFKVTYLSYDVYSLKTVAGRIFGMSYEDELYGFRLSDFKKVIDTTWEDILILEKLG